MNPWPWIKANPERHEKHKARKRELYRLWRQRLEKDPEALAKFREAQRVEAAEQRRLKKELGI